MIDYLEDLELVIAHTKHEKFRELCHESFPLHQQWRENIKRKALDYKGLAPPILDFFKPKLPNGKLRVGFIAPRFGQGGTEEWFRVLIKYLPSDKIEVTGLSIIDASDYNLEPIPSVRKLCPVAMGRDYAKSLISISDIIIVWAYGLGNEPDFGDKPVIAVTHGNQGCKWTQEHSDIYIPIATHWVKCSSNAYEPPNIKSTVLDNGFDLERLKVTKSRSSIRKSLEFDRSDKVILYHGRIVFNTKRLDAIIDAMLHLDKTYKLLLVGNGFQEREVLAMADQKLGNRYKHVPWTTEIGNYLEASDIAVLASDSEGLSIASIETLAYGIPLLSTPVGLALSHPEWFHMLPSLASPVHIAKTIKSAFSTLTKTSQKSKIAKKEVIKRYGHEAFANKWRLYLDQFMHLAKPEIKAPGLMQKAANFSRAIVTHAIAGFPTVSSEEAALRLSICKTCELYNESNGSCNSKSCGCNLDIKTTWRDQKCPHPGGSKWPVIKNSGFGDQKPNPAKTLS